MRLTVSQQRIMDNIGQDPKSSRQIARETGFSSAGMNYQLHKLEKMGLVDIPEKLHRTDPLRVTVSRNYKQKPSVNDILMIM